MEEDEDDGNARKRRAGRPKKPLVDRLDIGSDSDSGPSGSRARKNIVIDSDDDAGPSGNKRKRRAASSATASSHGSDSDSSSRTSQVSLVGRPMRGPGES